MIHRIIRYLVIALLLTSSETAFAGDATPVGPPTAPTVTARLANPGSTTNTDVIVEWSGGTDGGSPVTGYQVTPFIGTAYTTPASVGCSTGGPLISDSCTVSGLSFATKYKFKVRRTTAAGTVVSEFSNEITTGSQAQTVSITGTPTSYRFGDPDFQLAATASSGLSVAWSVPSTSDVCSVDLSGTVHFLKSGSCTVRATQDGSGSAYASAFAETTISSTVSLSATLGTATSVQSSQATLNAIVPFPGVNVTPTFCVSTSNSNASCSLPSGVNIGSYSPSTVTASSSTNVSAVASGLTQNSTYYFWITVSGSGASPYTTSTGSFTTVSGPSLAYSGSTSGTVGTAMSGTLTASSGSGVYASWSSASLPSGLSFSPGVSATTSSVSGTPTAAGNYTALFTVTDSSGLETQLNVAFTIAAQPAPTPTPTPTPTDPGTNNNSGSSSTGNSGSSTGTTTPPPTPGAGTDPGSSPSTPTAPKNEPGAIDNGTSGKTTYIFRDGKPVAATIDVIGDGRGLSVVALDWSVSAVSESSKLLPDQFGESSRRLSSTIQSKVTISGFGFKPQSQVDIFAFGAPQWISGLQVSKTGEFSTVITLPKSILPGDYVLQVAGIGLANQKQIANFPILVKAKGIGDFFLPSTLISKTITGPIKSTILVKDVPIKTSLSWKTEVSNKTRGIKSASIKLRLITIVPDMNFSGVILLPLQTKYSGVTVQRDVAITVLPLSPRSPQHAINRINETLISWGKSLNASKYLVSLGGQKICETTSASCVYKGIAGPNSRFDIKALGADGVESPIVKTKYVQTKPRLLATVNFENNSTSLDAKAIANLQATIQILMREGFSAINIIGYTDSVGKPASNLKLSTARAKAVSDIISGNIVGAVSAIGKGKSKPLKSNATKDGRAANRRVEIFVY